MDTISDLYNKRKNLLTRKHSKEVAQFNLEGHIRRHPTDYVAVIQNEKLKSDILHIDYLLIENEKRLEVYG